MGKPAPTSWWDHDMRGDIIVQSDYAGGECLARFAPATNGSGSGELIRQAESLIDDFATGRKTPAWGSRA